MANDHDNDNQDKKKKGDVPEGKVKVTRTETKYEDAHAKHGGGNKVLWALGVVIVLGLAWTMDPKSLTTVPGTTQSVVQTTTDCPGTPKTIELTTKWVKINPDGKCRVMSDTIAGAVELSGKKLPAFTPQNAAGRDVQFAHAATSRATFKYSLCPQNSGGIVNWDCSPIQQTAGR